MNVTSNAPVLFRMSPRAMSISPSAKTGEYIQYFRPAAASARLPHQAWRLDPGFWENIDRNMSSART